jgi:cytochrome c551/c552
MPATDRTAFNLKTLHKVFAASSIVLLAVTVWMFAVDHRRPWKQYQRTNDQITARMAEWRKMQLLSEDVAQERQRLEQALSRLAAQPFEESIDTIRAVVRDRDLSTKGVEPALPALDESLKVLRRMGSFSTVADRYRQDVIDALNKVVDDARFREEELERQRKFALSELDVAKAQLALAVRDGRPAATLKLLQSDIDRRKSDLDATLPDFESAVAYRQRIQQLVQHQTEAERVLRKKLDANLAESVRLTRIVEDKQSTYFTFFGPLPLPGKKWLELPVLDAFNSPRKIDNLWNEGLDQPAGSFGRVRRFDRCTTCHQGIQQELTQLPTQPLFPTELVFDFALKPASTNNSAGQTDMSGSDLDSRLQELFGFQLADGGLLRSNDVTIKLVQPQSAAARAAVWRTPGQSARAADLREQWLQTTPVGLSDASGPNTTAPDSVVPGLLMGDVIVAVNEQPVPTDSTGRAWLIQTLIESVDNQDKGQEADATNSPAVRVTVRRGLPHPFAGHPRLDLFVGTQSPHPMQRFGCTVCHEGQGSATSFEWASHTPNDSDARRRWESEQGWFDNSHWDYPMYPRRFAESLCLKCHHRVLDLDSSERYPDAPAPKVVEGYRLVRTFGCFGCHEISGLAGAKQIAPDLRLEPNYTAAALQFLNAPGTGAEQLTTTERGDLVALAADPENHAARERVLRMLSSDEQLVPPSDADELLIAADEGGAQTADGDEAALPRSSSPRFSSYVHQVLGPLLKDQVSPGTMRKVGPSLRHVRSKLDTVFLTDWIRQPSHFRPTTRMPQSFGLWNHLPGTLLRLRLAELESLEAASVEAEGSDANGERATQVRLLREELAQLDESERRYEPVAIHSIVTYLNEVSQGYAFLDPPAGITPVTTDEERQRQVERGQVVFQQSGCLACHAHKDFPDFARYLDSDAVLLGPDLSDLAAKFAPDRNPDGQRWLYSWIKQPSRYDVRTTMPDAQLNPVTERDENGQVVAVTDPVADLVVYLMNGSAGTWQPQATANAKLDDEQQRVLESLTVVLLRDNFPEVTARSYAQAGIPEDQARRLKGPEQELIVAAAERDAITPDLLLKKRVRYVARKSLAYYGCAACHDIPGLEDAKPIGPALTGWGRKNTAELAFGNVHRYLEEQSRLHGETGTTDVAQEWHRTAAPQSPALSGSLPQYFHDELKSHSRIGFLFQKLTEPRSYDYQETRNKKYTARLQMPQFSFSESQREAIMTFVLGLVSDPPTDKFAYRPDARAQSLLDGEEVLQRYQCRGCHVVEPEAWRLAFAADTFGERSIAPSHPFVPNRLSDAMIAASRQEDRRGWREAVVHGMPALGNDGRPVLLDVDEFPLEEEPDEPFPLDGLRYALDVWKPVALDGAPYQVGEGSLVVSEADLARRRHSRGGALAKYLLPHVLERERVANPNAKGPESWAWVPPPLLGEGAKVQPEWLHDYLLDPFPIRPAALMRMPKYSLSKSEARKLANYFSAKDNVPYPYPVVPERQTSYLAQVEQRYAQELEALAKEGALVTNALRPRTHLSDAMRIVTNGNYCIKCHRVGDFDPAGIDRVKAPDLSMVYGRLRPDYLRTWLAKPTAVLPYTSMPINIPYDPGSPELGSTLSQDLYPGDSLEQIQALVDLLMNYDRYAREQSRVAPLVAPSGAAPQ